MSSYTNFDADLDLKYHKSASAIFGRDMWVVLNPFRYYIGHVGSSTYVDVPEGFLTDGASVPRALWSIIPPLGLHSQAAVVHDYLCERGQVVKDGRTVFIDRAQTDAIFREALHVSGITTLKTWVMSTAVNMYRVMSGTTKPTHPPAKQLAETLITFNSLDGGFELTTPQIAKVKKLLEVS